MAGKLGRAAFVLVVLGACAAAVWFSFGPGASSGATWRVDGTLDRDSTRLPLLVTERECASGRSAEGRIQQPDVDYTRDAVVITVRVERRSGDQDCQGNPETPYLLELDEPVGDRRLLDGGTSPPTPPQNK